MNHILALRRWRGLTRVAMEVLAAKSLLLLLIVSSSTETAAAEEWSIRCLHALLTEIHAQMVFCGDRIDDKSEANHLELRIALEKFIRNNAVDDRYKNEQIEDHEKDTRQHLERAAPYDARICEHRAATRRRMFFNIVSAEEMAKIRKRLEIPSDPNEGFCL